MRGISTRVRMGGGRRMSEWIAPRSSFTLIEMLVVIAIISILSAMLLPSLHRAVDTARAMSCINNLKLVGTVFLQYANDFNHILPPARFCAGTTENPGQWRPSLGMYGYIEKYAIGNKDFSFCPETLTGHNGNNTYGVPMGNETYGIFCHESGPTAKYYAYRLSKINRNKHLLAADSRLGWTDENEYYMNGAFYLNNGNGAQLSAASTYKALSLRHNFRFNAVYPDGSANADDEKWITNSKQYYYVMR